LSSRRQSRAPALARQSRQRLRRYSFEHKKNFIEFTLHAGKAVFFSKERASLVCGDFSSWRLTWALLAEGPLYDVLFLPNFLATSLKKILGMNVMKLFKLAGSRIVKTCVSIFITAWICILLDWPPVFAVITAIVTIEPTVSDSIKKGIVRFPASAIGSAYAVLFISLFGNSPLTYTLAAVFT